MQARRVLSVTGIVALLCVGASAATEAPGWSSLQSALRKSNGSYRKQTTLTEGGQTTVLGEEFVAYDLKARWIDRRITQAGSSVHPVSTPRCVSSTAPGMRSCGTRTSPSNAERLGCGFRRRHCAQ